MTQQEIADLILETRIKALVIEGVDEEIYLARARAELLVSQDSRKDDRDYTVKQIASHEASIAYINEQLLKLHKSGRVEDVLLRKVGP